MTQQEVADAVGVTRLSVIQYESGRSSPSAETLAGMEAAGFDVRYVLTGMRDAPSGIDRERFRWAYTEVQRQAKVRHEKLTADASLDLAWRFYDAIGDLRAVPRRR